MLWLQGGDCAQAVSVEAAEALLHIYHCALQEFVGQVAVECKERALMLALLWDHFASLVVLRVNLNQQAVEVQREAEADVSGLEDAIADLQQQLKNQDAHWKVGAGLVTAPSAGDCCSEQRCLRAMLFNPC